MQTVASATTTKDGFVGDVGRWQHGLGIAVDAEDGGADEGGNYEQSRAEITVKDLMKDGSLKEVFAARGRHKKTPVLAR